MVNIHASAFAIQFTFPFGLDNNNSSTCQLDSVEGSMSLLDVSPLRLPSSLSYIQHSDRAIQSETCGHQRRQDLRCRIARGCQNFCADESTNERV